MKCSRCQHDNPAGTKFCGQCAAPLTSTCTSCGAANPPDNKFCGQCAAPLRGAMASKFAGPDRRVRLAANHAIDRQAINQAENLGFAKITSSIIPNSFDFYWQPPPYPYEPARARQLLAEAGYPNGFDAGEFSCDAAFVNVAEATANYLQAVGIRVKIRPLERAAFFKAYGEKKLKNLIQGASGAWGNAATRIEAFVASGGAYVYGSYPDIDGLFREQATEVDRKRREAMLHRIQQLINEKVMLAPIWQLAALIGVGPRVEESGIGLVAGYAFFSAPYEEVKLKGK